MKNELVTGCHQLLHQPTQLEARAKPAELDALEKFDATDGAVRDCYSAGAFELGVISRVGMSTWPEDPAFLGGVVEFAQADGSGTTCSSWVAEGAEPSVDFDSPSYHREEAEESSKRHEERVAWLGSRPQSEPVADADPLVERARALHQEPFAVWMASRTG